MRRVRNVAGVVGLALAASLTACSSSTTSSAPPPKTVPAADRPTAAQAHSCAAAHAATWVGCLVAAHSSFASVPITGLAIPGAHNAGTNNLDAQSADTQKGSACVNVTAKGAAGDQLNRWSTTQDQSITQQLDDGVRFIDLAVGYNGNGVAATGWRVVENQYSDYPLSVYLDQVANWAAGHHSEPVIVDLSTICYDHHPTAAIDAGLWANFATKTTTGEGTATMADVAFNPTSVQGGLATANVGDVTGQQGGGHNVVVLIPAGAKAVQTLTSQYHVHPVLTVAPGTKTPAGALEVEHGHVPVAPATTGDFSSANSTLGHDPLSADPALGTLVGRGLYVAQLHYDVGAASATAQSALFGSFGGLVKTAPGAPGAASAVLAPWGSGVWTGNDDGAAIVATWGHRTNVVLADGVQNGGFVPSVIAANAQ